MKYFTLFALLAVALLAGMNATGNAAEPVLKLKQNDSIAIIGNTYADRMQHYPWLETYTQAMHPELNLQFRNLGFSGDEITTRPRSANFGSADEWLAKTKADVVFCFFGYNEALRGEAGLESFRTDLAKLIDQMRTQKYNGKTAPQLVVFSPIAHENLHSPHLPDGAENNAKLAIYTDAMKQICDEKSVPFVDLFTVTGQMYKQAEKPLTMNGIHLENAGYKAVAKHVMKELFGAEKLPADVSKLHAAVAEKNYYWFSRYRVVDGYNVFGGRSKLAWFGQSNADVMKREMEVFDVMTGNRDKRIWAVAGGGDAAVDDSNIPELLEVKTNKPGPLPGGAWPYLGAEEAIKKMNVAQGMEVNVFASEEMFPRLVNPVQMAVDTDSRVWASVWPSYPHWNPTEKRRDALVILPDENNDGVADECIVFADELNSVTGFEFWGGGVLVAAPPEIWFLKDTDGDDKADVKIRMLQGISSADTHHSANAMVVGPDGWLYWSRGIFNVANFETPTRTYRSGQSGVHRFNPRTFEMEFHFPIGPNPHGDVFDQWGYQFANDGTSGTGSYVNIGKGVANKQWFKKRVRPVAATGLVSSSHFPPENEGNFLVCNTIGFLGVLQHEVKTNGADITAEEIEPIVFSTDRNFRPSDVEIGGDGALYIADWHNTLIGHMQHNMRDPNRDHEHGRIYRVTATGRDLVKPVKMKGKPIEEVCQVFFAKENSARYRARLELSGRDSTEVVAKISAFADTLNPQNANADRDESQALLECLWTFEEHRHPNLPLLKKVFQAEEPRVRAAAIRTFGHWAGKVDDWEPTLLAAARDEAALVRAEAVKAAVEMSGLAAAEVIFETATRPLDPELETVLQYAKSKIAVDALVTEAMKANHTLSPAAQRYVLQNASVNDLMKLKKSEAVYRAILNRTAASDDQMNAALQGLAESTGGDQLKLLMELIDQAQTQPDGNVAGFSRLLVAQPIDQLAKVKTQIEKLARTGKSAEVKRLGYAAWVAASGPDDAFLSASKSKENLRDFLDAVPSVDPRVRGQLFSKVEPLIFGLPTHLKSEAENGRALSGVQVEYFHPSGPNVAMETLNALKPQSVAVIPQIVFEVPLRRHSDQFAFRFTGVLSIPQAGKYTFYAASDDGSRIYLNGKLLVNNDGMHDMIEKSADIELPAGPHEIVVTYFDATGGNGLKVAWAGPGIKKQPIPASQLTVAGDDSLHVVAIGALSSIPGHDAEKFSSLASLIGQGRNLPAAIHALRKIPDEHWQKQQVGPLVDNLIGYLSSMPARLRTSADAVAAIALTKSLAASLPQERAEQVAERLQNLDVRVIAIGTTPHRMIYDKELIVVEKGKAVEFRFTNIDAMPHNFAIVQPGSLAEVGELAEATGREPDAQARDYIPKSDKILLASQLLQTGERQAISFEAPTELGVYPYVCTYPGHWRRMFGALYVVDSLEEYLANPVDYLAAANLPIKDELLLRSTRNREWKFDELIGEVREMPAGRNFEVGKQLFKVASCVGCHQLAGEGVVFGPDLAKLDEKKHTTEHILRSIIEPSKEIDEKYQSVTFQLDDGRVITGMIMKETSESYEIVVDPLAKGKPTVIAKEAVEEMKKSPSSLMPNGLINKLSKEEILDLIAFVMARGDKKNAMYHGHHHNH